MTDNTKSSDLSSQQECIFTYTICDMVKKIANNEILLPAIQRKFTWSEEQIETLFDSIMCGYPINTFMFWNVSSNAIKDTFKFYIFLKDYIEDFQDENIHLDTASLNDFDAVIDGQQRLTSLFIALKGSYSSKKNKKDTLKIGDNYPKKHLYLDLFYKNEENQLDYNKDQDDEDIFYKFKFLENEKAKDKDHLWFKVSEIFRLHSVNDIQNYLQNQLNLDLENEKAKDAQNILEKLHTVIFKKKLISAYQIKEEDFSKALKIFIRLNSGGTPLSTSNLLMSITTANWTKDARDEISSLINDVYNQNTTFLLNQDFILKACLYLTQGDFSYKLKNFSADRISKIEEQFQDISQCIKIAFKLFFELGFNGKTFRADNAALPVILWLYKNIIKNNTDIDIQNIKNDDKKSIKEWLSLSFIKRVFGGQSDNVLRKMRGTIYPELNSTNSDSKQEEIHNFPAKDIYKAFEQDAKHNYSIDENIIDGLLQKKKGDETFYLLNLLYPDIQSNASTLEQDHLHPASACKKEDKDTSSPWNCIENLQLLGQSENASKNDMPLGRWVFEKFNKDNGLDVKDACNSLLINKEFESREDLKSYLEFENRKTFFKERKEFIRSKIIDIFKNLLESNAYDIKDINDK